MKIHITVLILFFAFISNAQRSTFHLNNFYASSTLPYQSPIIITTGLQLNLEAANPSSYSGSGSNWNDLIGSNNGVLSNVTFESSPKTFVFNGSSSRISFSNGVTFGDNLTYEAWVNRSGGSGVIANFNSWNPGYVHFQFAGNNMQYALNPSGDKFGTSALNFNTWYQIVIAYSKSNKTASFYVNGALTNVETFGTASSISQQPFTIGAWDTNGAGAFDRYFSGKIAVFRAYNITLDATQVQFNYNAVKSGFGL